MVRLKGDLRRQEIQLERERERSLLPSADTSSSDRDKVSSRSPLSQLLKLDSQTSSVSGSKDDFTSYLGDE